MNHSNQSEYVIQVDGLNHFFGSGDAKTQALFDNHLDVKPGEIVIMTGPSGSGKTTLLTLIGTLRTVQDGSLKILGEELNGMNQYGLTQVRKKDRFLSSKPTILFWLADGFSKCQYGD